MHTAYGPLARSLDAAAFALTTGKVNRLDICGRATIVEENGGFSIEFSFFDSLMSRYRGEAGHIFTP